tara:strand:- start:900 stop:1418 length:519 start_codon:yes stop_codon:yes gene_type:complete
MKLTESKLKQIIVEELQKVLVEQDVPSEEITFEPQQITGRTRKETPRQILRRLSKKYGGVKGIRKLSRKNPDRLAYRAAYKAQRQGKTTVAMPEPGLTPGGKKARAVEPVPTGDAERQAAIQRRKEKRAAEIAAAEERRKKFKKQQAMAQAKVYNEPSTASKFQGREITPIK